MKNFTYFFTGVFLWGAVGAFVYSYFFVSEEKKPDISIISPKNGIECAVIVVNDAASVDCWKNKNIFKGGTRALYGDDALRAIEGEL